VVFATVVAVTGYSSLTHLMSSGFETMAVSDFKMGIGVH